MNDKRINLVQVNFGQGPTELNAYYLPYSAGVLWSYARSRPAIASEWSLGELAWKRRPIEDVYRQLADCSAIGFSSYIWNKNYNYELAREIKRFNPRCMIVFGGPEPPVERADLFDLLPFIDVVVQKEGEISFADLLQAGSTLAASSIPGLLINHQGRLLNTGRGRRIDRLDQIPSPYTSGVFDAIIADNPGVQWNATLETNRGCPYQCTFCDWGSLTYNKVKKFELERVFAEIEWMGAHHCDWMSIADANFGMFVQRDELIVDRVIDVQERHGYPRRTGISWAKNQKAEVVKLARRLTARGFNNGLTLSVQSLDDGVLTAIKRRNLEMNKLGEVFDLCAREGLTVNTELILGLPGETLQSWRNNVWQLLELNQHSGIEFLQAQLLENAEMNLRQREENRLTSVTVYDYMSGTDAYDTVPEGVQVVTSTRDLPTQDMLACQEFQWFINTWHIGGLSQWYSRFLRRYSGISYESFYGGLWDHLSACDWYQAERDIVMSGYRGWMTKGEISIEPVSGVKVHGWNLIHLTNLRMHASATYDRYHEAAADYARQRSAGLLGKDLIDDLETLTRAFTVRHGEIARYPLQVKLRHNIVEYVLHRDDLQSACHSYSFDFPEDKTMSLGVFMQNIYYARRRHFGKAEISPA